MGQSTDAILFYGYCWMEETSRPWTIGADDVDEDDDRDEDEDDDDADDDEWEARYARGKSCLPPSTPFPERMVKPTRENGWNSTPKDYSPAEQAIINQHTAYWATKRAIVEAATCCVGTHCSGECPMPYVAVKVSETTASRGMHGGDHVTDRGSRLGHGTRSVLRGHGHQDRRQEGRLVAREQLELT